MGIGRLPRRALGEARADSSWRPSRRRSGSCSPCWWCWRSIGDRWTVGPVDRGDRRRAGRRRTLGALSGSRGGADGRRRADRGAVGRRAGRRRTRRPGRSSGGRPGRRHGAGDRRRRDGVSRAGRAAPGRRLATGAGLALLAALLLGAMVVALDAGGDRDPVWTVFMVRVSSVALLWLVVAARRPSFATVRPNLATLVGAGVLDNLANLLFVLAAARGLLSLVSVLGSLYPVVTVVAGPRGAGRAPRPVAARRRGGGPHRRGADLARLTRATERRWPEARPTARLTRHAIPRSAGGGAACRRRARRRRQPRGRLHLVAGFEPVPAGGAR